MKKLLVLFSVFALMGVVFTKPAFASNDNYNHYGNVTICHKTGNSYQTLSVNWTAVLAHLLHGDKVGTCVVSTPSPTPTVTPTVAPTSSPEPTATPEETVSPEPTATPEATATPEESPVPTEQPVVTQTFSAPAPAGAPVCDTGGNIPFPIKSSTATRIGTNAVIAYWPTVIGGQVNARFRELGSTNWQHALRDYPNIGVAPIGFLRDGVKYEYQLTNGFGCNQSGWSRVFVGF